MKIFCTDYAQITGRALSPNDSIYLKPDSALINSGKLLYQPSFISQLSVLPQLVVRVERVGKSIAREFARRYWGREVALGLSFCGVDEAQETIASGQSPFLATGFDGSLAVGSWHSYVDLRDQALSMTLTNSRLECILPSSDLIDQYIISLSNYFLLKMGDLIVLPLLPQYIRVSQGENIHLLSEELIQVYVGVR